MYVIEHAYTAHVCVPVLVPDHETRNKETNTSATSQCKGLTAHDESVGAIAGGWGAGDMMQAEKV
jgi:hypothetical protein